MDGVTADDDVPAYRTGDVVVERTTLSLTDWSAIEGFGPMTEEIPKNEVASTFLLI